MKKFAHMAVVGTANIVDCVEQSASRWFVGRFGFVLADARRITPIPLKGRLGLFDAPPDIIARIAAVPLPATDGMGEP